MASTTQGAQLDDFIARLSRADDAARRFQRGLEARLLEMRAGLRWQHAPAIHPARAGGSTARVPGTSIRPPRDQRPHARRARRAHHGIQQAQARQLVGVRG